MAGSDVLELINGQFANDVALQARAANSAFVTNMASVQTNHARCAQVLDKRISEYDIEENRAATSIDPAAQSFWLSKANQDGGNVNIGTGLLLEILRSVQTGAK
jgi:hypothetical protein